MGNAGASALEYANYIINDSGAPRGGKVREKDESLKNTKGDSHLIQLITFTVCSTCQARPHPTVHRYQQRRKRSTLFIRATISSTQDMGEQLKLEQVSMNPLPDTL